MALLGATCKYFDFGWWSVQLKLRESSNCGMCDNRTVSDDCGVDSESTSVIFVIPWLESVGTELVAQVLLLWNIS